MRTPVELPRHPFTLADLDRLGITRAALRRALTDGTVRRATRGVYVAADLADTLDLRVAILTQAVSPGHVICDRTAGWLHGVDLLLEGEDRRPTALETCVFRSFNPTSRGEVTSRTRDLAASDVMELRGLLVTTPLRTALDLGCILRRRDALAALDQFRSRFGFTVPELRLEAVRYFRRRGVVQLRELIPLADPLAESVRESWTRLAIIDAGLRAPVLQHEIVQDGQVLWRLDLAYPLERVAVEYDGVEFHHTAEQLAYDERRRAWLREHGWTVIVVRSGDFSNARLNVWLTQLRDALRPTYSNLRW